MMQIKFGRSKFDGFAGTIAEFSVPLVDGLTHIYALSTGNITTEIQL